MKSEHENDIEKMNRENFRSALEALARPGRMQPLQPLFGSGILAMASVLLYAEATFYYEGTLDFQLMQAICGSRLCHAGDADYLFADSISDTLIQTAKSGTPESPEQSAILLFSCSLTAGTGLDLLLSGPGVRSTQEIRLPVSRQFIDNLMEKNDSFPMGVDLFFISNDNGLLGIPRTTRIEVIS